MSAPKGRPAKPNEQRQRAERKLTPIQGALSLPEPPPNLSEGAAAIWRKLWREPVAGAWRASDAAAVERLASYLNEWRAMNRVHNEEPFALGSTKQPTISPAGRRLVELEGTIARLESELGLTPLARQRLGIAVTQATLTLQELNAESMSETDEAVDTLASSLATDGSVERPP